MCPPQSPRALQRHLPSSCASTSHTQSTSRRHTCAHLKPRVHCSDIRLSPELQQVTDKTSINFMRPPPTPHYDSAVRNSACYFVVTVTLYIMKSDKEKSHMCLPQTPRALQRRPPRRGSSSGTGGSPAQSAAAVPAALLAACTACESIVVMYVGQGAKQWTRNSLCER